MTETTKKLEQYLDTFALIEDRSERIQLLIDIADRFREVPPEVAIRPFPRRNRAPHCESDAYVWVVPRPDGVLDLHFAVENPQGISARALAVILQDSFCGESPDRVAAMPSDLPYALFGKELSMGKTMGLTAMVAMVKNEASRLASDG